VHGSDDDLPQLPGGRFLDALPLSDPERRFKHAVEHRWPDRKVLPSRGIAGTATEGTGSGTRWAASTSVGSTLRDALATGRTTLRSSCVVRHVTVDPETGLANGVAVIDAETRREEVLKAPVVLLCASTLETLRILLNSRSPQHPNGLGNSHDLLGRYVMDHFRVLVVGDVPLRAGELAAKAFGGPGMMLIPCFRNIHDRHPDFIRGYQLLGAAYRTDMPSFAWVNGDIPVAGDGQIAERLRRKESGATDHASFILTGCGEQLAERDNRVTLSTDLVDEWGIPSLHIACAQGDNERKMARDIVAQAQEMARAAGFEPTAVVSTPSHPGWLIHECGGARMGTDPKTSVVNAWNQLWDSPNLLVTDGACWVSSGWANSTHTMMALTLRACERLVERLKSDGPSRLDLR
jgi:choline dehydrogenase-like flavoprotein